MGINLKHNGAGAEVLYQLLLCEVITKHIKMLGVILLVVLYCYFTEN